LSTIVKSGKATVQSSNSFNSLLNSIRQESPLISGIDDAIDKLDLADGLKKLLLTYGFTLELLLTMSSNDLAEILGIDKYVADIIINSAINSKELLEWRYFVLSSRYNFRNANLNELVIKLDYIILSIW